MQKSAESLEHIINVTQYSFGTVDIQQIMINSSCINNKSVNQRFIVVFLFQPPKLLQISNNLVP